MNIEYGIYYFDVGASFRNNYSVLVFLCMCPSTNKGSICFSIDFYAFNV